MWAICNATFEHPGLLDLLFGFLDRDPPLNAMVGSYTARVCGMLLQKKTKEVRIVIIFFPLFVSSTV